MGVEKLPSIEDGTGMAGELEFTAVVGPERN
jgi:hypothetical protein